MAQPLIDTVDDATPVSCERCQACCCQLQVILMPHDDPPAVLTEVEEHGLTVMQRGDDGWCVALDRDSLRCTIYARRPQVCRDFATDSVECRIEREDWRRAARRIAMRVE